VACERVKPTGNQDSDWSDIRYVHGVRTGRRCDAECVRSPVTPLIEFGNWKAD